MKGDVMDKTELENYFDSLFKDDSNGGDPDAFDDSVDDYATELGTDVLLLEKSDLLRLLRKCLRALDMEFDRSTNGCLELQRDAEKIIMELEQGSSARISKLANEFKQMASEEKSRAAKKRHAPTYELRDKIIAHWRDNISLDKSNEFAAEMLQKQFPEVAHRTLARYVAEAKKLPPAGTL
jgi:hypothetical protein